MILHFQVGEIGFFFFFLKEVGVVGQWRKIGSRQPTPEIVGPRQFLQFCFNLRFAFP